jgi:hypothetical protein
MKKKNLFLVSLVALVIISICVCSCSTTVSPDKYQVEEVSSSPLKLRVKNVSNETFSGGLDFNIKLVYYDGTSVSRYGTTSANFAPGDVQNIAGLIDERNVKSWEIIEAW